MDVCVFIDVACVCTEEEEEEEDGDTKAVMYSVSSLRVSQ